MLLFGKWHNCCHLRLKPSRLLLARNHPASVGNECHLPRPSITRQYYSNVSACIENSASLTKIGSAYFANARQPIFSFQTPTHRINKTISNARKNFSNDATISGRKDSSSSSISSTSYDRDSGIIALKTKNETTQYYQTIIGIEIHAQLQTPSKLFSSAPTKHHCRDAKNIHIPNSCVETFDLAYPGTLPLLSSHAVIAAVRSSAALKCDVHEISRFERKHYAYADLPLGYQMTQQRWPLATNGLLSCRVQKWDTNEKKKKSKKKKKKSKGVKSNQASNGEEEEEKKFFHVGIERVQIEQDTGKTTTITHHDEASQTTQRRSLIDLNRSGCALIEIVFRPDIRSAHQAASVVETLQQLLRHIGTCDGKMEQGSLRCDLNVSIAPVLSGEEGGSHPTTIDGTSVAATDNSMNPFAAYLPPNTGQRVEVKNLNSFRQVIAATEYEALRQVKCLYHDEPTAQETRTFHVSSGTTVKLRSKEGAVDYRFLPEPDLPPLVLNPKSLGGQTLDEIIKSLPELPEEVTQRLVSDYGVFEELALLIASDPPAIHMFETAVSTALLDLAAVENDTDDNKETHSFDETEVATAVSNWLCNDLFGLVKESATADAASTNITSSTNKISEEGLNHPISVEYSTVNGNQLGSLVAMVMDSTISTRAGKQILSIMYQQQQQKHPQLSPRDIAEERGWKLITDPLELQSLCRRVVFDKLNETQRLQYHEKGGRFESKIEKYFVGKVMGLCQGNAHPVVLVEALKLVLKEKS